MFSKREDCRSLHHKKMKRVKLVFACGRPAPQWLELSEIKAKRVEDVCRYIQKEVGLVPPVACYLEGCALRNSQSVSVLRDNDTLWCVFRFTIREREREAVGDAPPSPDVHCCALIQDNEESKCWHMYCSCDCLV